MEYILSLQPISNFCKTKHESRSLDEVLPIAVTQSTRGKWSYCNGKGRVAFENGNFEQTS